MTPLVRCHTHTVLGKITWYRQFNARMDCERLIEPVRKSNFYVSCRNSYKKQLVQHCCRGQASLLMHSALFSQPSIYIDGWLYGMRMTSVVCNVPVLSQNDSTYHHSVFTTWKWHPFATWTPSFIILVRKLKKNSQKYQRTVGYPSTSWASCIWTSCIFRIGM